MVKAFSELTKRQKLYFLILLVVGFISPAIGLVVFLFARKKTQVVLLRNASLIGAALAMAMYVSNYLYLLLPAAA